MKRFLDLSLSLALMIILLPLVLSIAACVWVKLGRPVLFKQVRSGLHGRPFTLYKFRTMWEEGREKGIRLHDADRTPPFGRILRAISLDELPQLFNVMRGDMSLVGPRPLLPEYLMLYTREESRRHDVLPGITGWAQVNGRNAITWEEKFSLDLWYVENRSFTLDLIIIFLTLYKLFRRVDIRETGEKAMPHLAESRSGKRRV